MLRIILIGLILMCSCSTIEANQIISDRGKLVIEGYCNYTKEIRLNSSGKFLFLLTVKESHNPHKLLLNGAKVEKKITLKKDDVLTIVAYDYYRLVLLKVD